MRQKFFEKRERGRDGDRTRRLARLIVRSFDSSRAFYVRWDRTRRVRGSDSACARCRSRCWRRSSLASAAFARTRPRCGASRRRMETLMIFARGRRRWGSTRALTPEMRRLEDGARERATKAFWLSRANRCGAEGRTGSRAARETPRTRRSTLERLIRASHPCVRRRCAHKVDAESRARSAPKRATLARGSARDLASPGRRAR